MDETIWYTFNSGFSTAPCFAMAAKVALTTMSTGELNKLKDTLSTVKAVLVDAEELQETNAELSVWLEALKDVCYAIDDILDEFDVIALQQQVNQRSTQRKVFRGTGAVTLTSRTHFNELFQQRVLRPKSRWCNTNYYL
ncbi:hypothetical protein RJ640_007101 [Escallonia rubra]|uniref:Disease resistance N-terminal domain-containing protein n=1 Tax=Escallonia rubra TaxID=112253 RepID=A0AA88SFR2_9ASTE|nr:hypothetical protein RJ640_007101 [Escallonia rubra]